MLYVFALILSLAFIVLGIVRWKIHPFFVLFIAAIGYGFITGMGVPDILNAINEGFGGLMGKIGLIIFFGVVIGTVLEKSGGAMVIAEKMIHVIGEKSIHLAMLLTGYLMSIPVFADSAFIMMNSLNKALSQRAKKSYAGTSVALGLGLFATHVMVPPTPGPIAAAGILKADLGNVILWGIIVSSIALVPSYFFATKIASKTKIPIFLENVKEKGYRPKLWISLLSILVPIFLIVLKSVFDYPDAHLTSSVLYPPISFLGTPVIALLLGVALSLMLPRKLDERVYSATGWFGEALKSAAPIILITGAGGVFGKMLQSSGIAELITENFSDLSIGLFLPFLLAACLKTTQGSSTVALITTASIIAPIMPALGLDSSFMATMTVLAIGAGSLVVSHANDSFFWVFTQLTGMDVKQGNKTLTLGTLVLGVSAILVIFAITVVIG
ncbi:GntP family permease [Maribacter polysiphoniae]|uniref:GntP family gluconate:H+ symporter n=1 Tax=Maribacter polysiphoniae TaxID=429344 RepID=A0A316E3L9_9FLAO|nr:GntP family permease [Maribacter polysiphoniae]MBD1260903.1 GntP family permease [Maribacter polysiphoniae]PWK23959.1 GntP family gluconate:H+ symporter [Maribacter polysiphoniae]